MPAAPLFAQVSVSPQGFPSRKNRFPPGWPGFAPLFTGQVFIVRFLSTGTCIAGTHVKLPGCPGWHARRPMVRAADKRHVGLDFIRKFIP